MPASSRKSKEGKEHKGEVRCMGRSTEGAVISNSEHPCCRGRPTPSRLSLLLSLLLSLVASEVFVKDPLKTGTQSTAQNDLRCHLK